VINTVSTLVCVLVSATGKLGINAGSSSMLFEGLYWVGPCIKLLDSVEADRVSLILNPTLTPRFSVSPCQSTT
jgi:hypothetical protein